MDLAEIAAELYGLPTSEFTATRDAHVKALKAAGQKELAKTVGALRRPTVAAWMLNQLVRELPATGGQLHELGAALRDAQAALSGPALRQLSQQRQQVVSMLAGQARGIAAASGQKVTDDLLREVETTLNAALADPAAAVAVASGTLTHSTTYAGLGFPISDEVATPTGSAGVVAAPLDLGAARERKAEQRDQQAEATKQEEERKAEAGRRAEAERNADDERKAEEERKAESERKAEEERNAEAERAAAGAAAAAAAAALESAQAEAQSAQDELDRRDEQLDEATAALDAARDEVDRIAAELAAAKDRAADSRGAVESVRHARDATRTRRDETREAARALRAGCQPPAPADAQD